MFPVFTEIGAVRGHRENSTFLSFFLKPCQRLSCSVIVRMHLHSSTDCVVTLTPDDKADQRVPRDNSGAQAPKIVFGSHQTISIFRYSYCSGKLGLGFSVHMLLLQVCICPATAISFNRTVHDSGLLCLIFCSMTYSCTTLFPVLSPSSSLCLSRSQTHLRFVR